MDKERFIGIANYILLIILILIIPTWFDYGDSEWQRRKAWLIQYDSWNFRQLGFPILVLFMIKNSKIFWAYLFLTMFTFFTNLADLGYYTKGFVDKYDFLFRSIKIGLWIITITYLIDYYFPFLDRLKQLTKR